MSATDAPTPMVLATAKPFTTAPDAIVLSARTESDPAVTSTPSAREWKIPPAEIVAVAPDTAIPTIPAEMVRAVICADRSLCDVKRTRTAPITLTD